MEQRDVFEARTEAPDSLRRERDLRDEHDRATPGCDCGLARADVDLRLPAACRAGEEDVAAAGREEFGDARECGSLRFGELRGNRPCGKRGGGAWDRDACRGATGTRGAMSPEAHRAGVEP